MGWTPPIGPGLEAAWRAAADEAAARPGAECLGEYSVRGQSTQERVQVWLFPDAEGIESFWTALWSRAMPIGGSVRMSSGCPSFPLAGASG